MDEQLVAILSQENFLPHEALLRAAADPETIAEPVLRLLAAAADDPDALTEGEANLLFWGLHAMAAARDTRVFAPLLRLLRQDGEALEGLLGDALDATLPRVLASTFDGNAEALHRLILDSTVESYPRDAAIHALAFLTREGRLEREATRRLLERFDEARVSVEDGPGWIGWEEAIAFLGLADLQPRVAAARKDGRLPGEVSDPVWFRRALRQVTGEPPDYGAFAPERYGYLDDPIEALRWTAEGYGQPVRNAFKDVGRNDPCPCGSGRKFKKCCGAAHAAAEPFRPLPHPR